MDDKELRLVALEMHYRGIARQAFRFIMEVGGPQALDRFEKLALSQLDGIPRPVPVIGQTVDVAKAALVDDMKKARDLPDLI